MTDTTITPTQIADRIEGVHAEIKELRHAVHGAGPGPVDSAPLHDFLKDLDRSFTVHAGSLSVYLNQLRAS